MKKLIVALAALLALTLVAVQVFREPITQRLVLAGAGANMLSSLLDDLPDGLHLVLCGAGSPLPDPERSGPCVAVVAGERLFVVDAGSGASRNLGALRLPQGRIEAVLLTHFHSDHIDGLGELQMQRWVNGGHTVALPLHGPPGVGRIAQGINLAYAADQTYRTAHHGEDIAPTSGAGLLAYPFAVPPDGERAAVLDRDGVKVEVFSVDHAPVAPAVGYRFEYGGRSLVISGDTAKSANLEQNARGVDLLVHEALSPTLVGFLTEAAQANGRDDLAKITLDILDYHASPVEAAESARAAGVGHLLFHHIVPPLIVPTMPGIFLDGTADAYDGPITLGRDGTLVSLPAGSEDIDVEELL